MIDHSFAVTWMNDFEEFHNSLDQETTYTSNLTRSLSLVLDQFYSDIKVTTTTRLLHCVQKKKQKNPTHIFFYIFVENVCHMVRI